MGQLIIPNEIKIKGPWILSENDLEELDDVLMEIDRLINKSYHIEIEKEIEKKFPELKKWDEKITREEAKEKIKNSYPFSNSEKYAILIAKDGKKLVDSSLIGILKDKSINDFSPSILHFEIRKGPISYRLVISSIYNGELESKISIIDDNFANEINYKLNKWVRKNRPNIVLQFWNSTLPYIVILLFLLITLISMFFITTTKDNYKNELKLKSKELLRAGIDSTNINDAVELILKLKSDYVPEGYLNESTLNAKVLNVWIYSSICLLLLAIYPKTIIGVGRKKRLSWFYQKWIYIVTVFIPLTILLPILMEKLL